MRMFSLKKNELLDVVSDVVYENPEKNPFYSNLLLHQQLIKEEICIDDLYDVRISSLATELKFIHDETTGKVLGYEEVKLENLDQNEISFFEKKTPFNSMSLNRLPSLNNTVRGNPENFPFKPANVNLTIEREIFLGQNKEEIKEDTSKYDDFINFDNFLDKPKNFETGLFNNNITKNLKEFYSFSQQINDQLLNDINICSKEFKNKIKEEVLETNEDQNDKEKKLNKQIKKAPVITLSLKDVKQKNYFDTKFVKVLDVNEDLDNLDKLIPNPAKKFPFELDTFQKKAILCLEQKKNVMVVAHTSAGKTVIAEYAISLSFKNLTRTIYTSPIKALSNQKYRDFRLMYGSENVGLLTGDIQLNQDAHCLIMTTEILLQMLYNGSELIRDLEWVIFDEVHYINDKDRGHIWEEIFILLPDHISLVLLSATVSNVNEFGDWLGKVRNKVTHIVYTQKRPVPLEHYLYLGTDGKKDIFFKIINQFEKFDSVEYNKAVNFQRERELKRTSGIQRNKLKSGAAGAKNKILKPKDLSKCKIDPTEKNVYISLIRYLQKNDKLPLIVFMFSRQKCNDSGSVYWKAMDLCRSREKSRIHIFINNSLQKLKKSDRELTQVLEITTMLKNGFGIHHSGVLPFLREITEILFQQGLVKVLFATETFAMGINMPAKSVVFDSMEKHDGLNKRELLSSEYIQMAGRAGRRGKDETGTVIIICNNEVPSFSSLAKSISNKVLPLESKFKLTYSMILNILRVRHHLRIESIMEKSFVEHNIQSKFSSWVNEKNNLEFQLKTVEDLNCSLCKTSIETFCFDYLNYLEKKVNVMPIFCEKALSQRKLIEIGSIVIYSSIQNPFYVGVVLKINLRSITSQNELRIIGFNVFDLYSHMGNIQKMSGEIRYISLEELDCITKLSCSNIKIPEKDSLNNEESKNICLTLFEKLIESNPDFSLDSLESLFFMPIYNPSKDLKMNEMEFTLQYNDLINKRVLLLQKQCTTCKDFYNHYNLSMNKVNLINNLQQIQHNLSCESLQFLPDYRKRIEILKQLGFINKENVLTLKGKVACIISEHELLITDLLVDGFFQDLDPEGIAAIVSCFVFQNKSNISQTNDFLENKIIGIKKNANRLDNIQKSYGLTMNSSEILESLNYSIVHLVYEWAKGKSFCNVMNLTNVQEGIIVRSIQRIDELLKNLVVAAKLIGNNELALKINEASKCIRRDIVFSISLYVQEDINLRYKD